jgi:hypothetical protein
MPFVSTKENSMNRLLAIAAGVGLATVAGAQGKPVTNTGPIQRTENLKAGEAITLPVVSETTNDRSTTLVLDISGEQSWDSLGDSSNTILQVPIPAGSLMTGIGWDVNIATVGASWLSEARLYFDGSDHDYYGLFLTPGVVDTTPGTGHYTSSVIDLTDNGIPDIPIQADGILYIELFEGYDDVADAVDADWLNPSTLTIVYGAPPTPHICSIWSEDFDSGVWPPAGWTVIDNTATLGGAWTLNSTTGRPNNTGGSGDCAIIDSDWYGSSNDQDTELWTNSFFVPAGGATLEYKMDLNYLSGEVCDVDVSTDGGLNWTNLDSYAADMTGLYGVDLTAYGGFNVIVRWHYYLASWEWWWEIDDVALVYNAGAAFRNGGTNPSSYTVSGPPLMGESFDAMIDVGSTGNALGELYAFAGPLSLTVGGTRTLLIDVTHPAGELLALSPVAGPIATYTLPVPNDCGIFGVTAYTQAAHFGGGAPWVLSNAQDLTIGY